MSTRSSARNLFPPLDNLELTIRRRSRVDPTLLNNFEMATDGNGDLPIPDLRTMEELCQPTLNVRGGPITPIAIQATNFGLKNDMIQQDQNSCQFHGLLGDDFNKHFDKFLHVTQSIKVNGSLMMPFVSIVGQTQNVYVAGAYNQGGNSYQPQDLKGITTRSGNAYQGPMIPTTSSPLKVVERETEVTKGTMPPTNNGSTKDVQPLVVQIETPIPNSEPVVAPIAEPVIAPINVLILMPKFGPTIKILLINKEKLFKLARTPLNEHCSVVLLKKLPEKLGDPELSPTCMNLELTDRLISRPVEVAEDVFVKAGTFHFPVDFVVVDFDADPRVPLVLGRSFLKTERSLVDVYKGELTFRVGKEAVTFNLDQTLRYSANYDVMSVNRIDLFDIACEEYSQEVFGFSMSGNPTPSTEPIISNSSPTLTPSRTVACSLKKLMLS
uniref:Reverse transcriptase domain-containing protein n=1 Tax=Tanacetum cinerariifolium TaxID=118510 RepID=A0A6L2LLN0_TANCI|nr:hypothetical protein [Tanacetum cinerariifolium]